MNNHIEIKTVKYERQMPMEVINKVSGLMHLRLVTEIKITENKGFWDVEVVER